MSWWEALILGIVQGLTEFLPISSSGHISIVGQLIGSQDPGSAFTAITQLGTETAVILYFWRDIVTIVTKWCKALAGKVPQSDPDVRMGWFVIVGSLPIVVLGMFLESLIDTHFRNLWVTAFMLIFVGILLFLADRFSTHRKELHQLSWRDALLLGLAQAAALIPGVSRSGATISAGLALGYTRPAAARYAFLLAVPAVMGSGIYKLFDVGGPGQPPIEWGPIILATVVSFVVGLAVIHWLMRYISNNSFTIFVVYRIALGIVVILLLLTGILVPQYTF